MSMKKAVKSQKRLRMALSGASGAGKTRSALEIAKHLGTRIGLIDTEYKSASLYADVVDFDVEEIVGDYNPERLIRALGEHGPNYDVLIVDSLTHFWNGKNGMLDLADQEVKKMTARGGKADSFSAWKAVSPLYNRTVQAILGCQAHVIVTIRAKQSYERENGKIQKVGLAPEIRENFNYEMDVEGLLDQEHNLLVGKTRFEALDGKLFNKPGKEVAEILLRCLDGVQEIDLTRTPAPTQPPPGPNDTIPAPPRVPSLVVELTTALEAAVGNPEALVEIRKDIAAKAKEKLISREEFEALGVVYNRVRSTAA